VVLADWHFFVALVRNELHELCVAAEYDAREVGNAQQSPKCFDSRSAGLGHHWVGCLLLLLKRSVALYFLLFSLVGLMVSIVPVYGVIHAGVPFSAFEFGMYVIATPLLGLFLVWFAKRCVHRGWLR